MNKVSSAVLRERTHKLSLKLKKKLESLRDNSIDSNLIIIKKIGTAVKRHNDTNLHNIKFLIV